MVIGLVEMTYKASTVPDRGRVLPMDGNGIFFSMLTINL